jgi:hypothetical protein
MIECEGSRKAKKGGGLKQGGCAGQLIRHVGPGIRSFHDLNGKLLRAVVYITFLLESRMERILVKDVVVCCQRSRHKLARPVSHVLFSRIALRS